MALPLLAIILQGCLSVGPSTIEQDRFDNGQTIAESGRAPSAPLLTVGAG